MIDEHDDAEVNEDGLPDAEESDEEEAIDGPQLNEFGDPLEE